MNTSSTAFDIPICVCNHPLDAHDYKTNVCILFGCACVGFTDSGRREKKKK